MTYWTHHRTINVNGIDVFYREAGDAAAPVVLLLHGFPASSRMFRDLIPAISGSHRVIAPDYPGFGHSATPERSAYSYSFNSYAELLTDLLRLLKVDRFALYGHDFGAAVGFRLALQDPQRVTSLIIQNGNAYDEGLSSFFAPLVAHWRAPTAESRSSLRSVLTQDAVRWQYLEGVADPSCVDPDNWVLDHALLSRPGVDEIMLDLFEDYRHNIALYPKIHAYLRKWSPKTLIVWGVFDPIFCADGARAYLRELPDAELHLLDSGHFALQDKKAEVAGLVRAFLVAGC